MMHCRVQVLLAIETEHLSANNTVQGASTQSMSIPFNSVITGSLNK